MAAGRDAVLSFFSSAVWAVVALCAIITLQFLLWKERRRQDRNKKERIDKMNKKIELHKAMKASALADIRRRETIKDMENLGKRERSTKSR